MNKKEKQIVYLSASIAAGCRPCTKYHLRKSSDIGLSEFYIKALIASAISIRKKATYSMESFTANQNSGDDIKLEVQRNINRNDILAGIAAAYSVNFPSGLKKYISFCRHNGITKRELEEVIAISRSVIDMARAHVDMIMHTLDNEQTCEKQKEKECCRERN